MQLGYIPGLPEIKDDFLNEEMLEAANTGDVEQAIELLKRGANVNATDKVGDPRHLCVCVPHASVARVTSSSPPSSSYL